MYKKQAFFLLAVIVLLFSSCAVLRGAPSETREASSSPSDPTSPSPQFKSPSLPAEGLYSGPYEDHILPASIPEISDADRETFDPEKAYDYLASSGIAEHAYTIREARLDNDTLYITVEDTLLFEFADDAYQYLIGAFALSDEVVLDLPEFSSCFIEDGLMASDNYSYFNAGSRILEPLPVNEDILISSYYPEDESISLEGFKEFLLGNRAESGKLDIDVSFECSEGRITDIYYDNGEQHSNDPLSVAIYPRSYGYGSLPMELLDTDALPTEKYDPGKAADLLISSLSEFDNLYFITKAKFSGGSLYLWFTVDIRIDANIAYEYLRSAFSLSDEEILALPLFEDCSLHRGKMYTPDQWGLATGDPPENYGGDYNYNCLHLKEMEMPGPVRVAKDADIILSYYFDEEYEGEGEDSGPGYLLTVKEFSDYILDGTAQRAFTEDDPICISSVLFKYSNGEITALVEEYVP